MKKTRLYHGATKEEKLLYVLGVPHQYWSIHKKQITFNTLVYKNEDEDIDIHIGEDEQQKWFDVCFGQQYEDLYSSGIVVGIGSLFADVASQMCGFSILRLVASRTTFGDIQNTLAVVNLATADLKKLVMLDPQFLLLYNLGSNSPKERLALAKDIITAFPFAFRVVCVAGSSPVEFFYDYMQTPLDVALYCQSGGSY